VMSYDLTRLRLLSQPQSRRTSTSIRQDQCFTNVDHPSESVCLLIRLNCAILGREPCRCQDQDHVDDLKLNVPGIL